MALEAEFVTVEINVFVYLHNNKIYVGQERFYCYFYLLLLILPKRFAQWSLASSIADSILSCKYKKLAIFSMETVFQNHNALVNVSQSNHTNKTI